MGWITPVAIHSQCGDDGATVTLLIDGNITTYWAHSFDHDHWIIIDLGATHKVEKIRMYKTSSARSKWMSVDIYVSDDPGVWGAAVAVGQNFIPNNTWNESAAFSKAGRYIKLDGIDPDASGNNLYGYEFEALAAQVYQANDGDSDADVADREDLALVIVA